MHPSRSSLPIRSADLRAGPKVHLRALSLATAMAVSVGALSAAPVEPRSDDAWLKEACLAWRSHIDDRLRWLQGTSLLPRDTEDEVRGAIERASLDCDTQPAPASLSRLRSIAVFLEAVAQSDQQ